MVKLIVNPCRCNENKLKLRMLLLVDDLFSPTSVLLAQWTPVDDHLIADPPTVRIQNASSCELTTAWYNQSVRHVSRPFPHPRVSQVRAPDTPLKFSACRGEFLSLPRKSCVTPRACALATGVDKSSSIRLSSHSSPRVLAARLPTPQALSPSSHKKAEPCLHPCLLQFQNWSTVSTTAFC